ncbi:MAG: hypothetical protein M1354_02920 [Candidatus Marsarchaeota archaeon]|jgi:hypothetical protein|nr:hypothetical protein [Candidatus Marsarchaeota archaeon]
MRRKVVCIICGKEKDGIPVKIDSIIKAIRWIKTNITRNEKNNILVVCRDDYQAYAKARKKYTSRQALYLTLGVIFFIIGNVMALSLAGFAITVLVLAMFYGLSLLSYAPALELRSSGRKGSKKV